MLYVVRTGCQWRMRPHDFPPGKAVYQIFFRWQTGGKWERLHDALRKRVRQNTGKQPTPAAAIIDSRSVKTTEVGGDGRGYDAGKKVTGRKRHIVVDTLGLLLAVVVQGARPAGQQRCVFVLHAPWEKMKRIRVIFVGSAYGRPDRTPVNYAEGIPFVQRLRKARPDTPIVLIEKAGSRSAWLRAGTSNQEKMNEALRFQYERLIAEGVRGLFYVDGDVLLGDDGEGTVDDVHPDDIGFTRISDALEPLLRRLADSPNSSL